MGDKVWLNLQNVKTDRLCKKLDAKQVKYTVTEVLGSHSYRLDVPPGIHNVFGLELLKLAATDPLISQSSDDSQPNPVIVDDVEEFGIDEIRGERKRGRGRQYLVK